MMGRVFERAPAACLQLLVTNHSSVILAPVTVVADTRDSPMGGQTEAEKRAATQSATSVQRTAGRWAAHLHRDLPRNRPEEPGSRGLLVGQSGKGPDDRQAAERRRRPGEV